MLKGINFKTVPFYQIRSFYRENENSDPWYELVLTHWVI